MSLWASKRLFWSDVINKSYKTHKKSTTLGIWLRFNSNFELTSFRFLLVFRTELRPGLLAPSAFRPDLLWRSLAQQRTFPESTFWRADPFGTEKKIKRKLNKQIFEKKLAIKKIHLSSKYKCTCIAQIMRIHHLRNISTKFKIKCCINA